jgi:glyoxylase-like metal-dependent hydrolase (beta-lactamase superfamily II)
VEKIVFTHSHPDHIGLAGWFQKNYQFPVYISDLSYKEIQGLRDPTSGKWMHDLFIQHGGPDVAEELMLSEASAYEFEPDEIFGQHERIKLGNDMYQILWTPGHAPDHLCYYQQERQLMVVGDHVLDEISPIIAIWSAEVLNPLQDYFDSLELISGYAVNLALPGHGDLIRNLPARAEAIKLGHLRRMQQICHSIKNEAKTAGQIYQEIYGKLSIYKFFAPLMTTISRLFYLESIGKVRREEKKGIYYYSLTE